MSAPKRKRCQALDSHARRCRRFAAGKFQYHGADDLYGFLSDSRFPQWIVAYLCGKHSEPSKAKR